MSGEAKKNGALAWMANNRVASNLLMALFIVGGLLMSSSVKQEVFPEIETDTITISVVYPGASPSEVEQGVVLVLEEAAAGVEGVKEVSATAVEGMATIRAKLLTGADRDAALSDMRSAVDQVTSLPVDIERPDVRIQENKQRVVTLIISGEVGETNLKALGEKIRTDLLGDEGITKVELDGVRNPEISIEVDQDKLRRYGLTYEQVAAAIRNASIDLPGGSVKTGAGEVMIRTSERRYTGAEFAEIVVLSTAEGTEVRLKDLGFVIDGVEEVDRESLFNGERAISLQVYRVGVETPNSVSDAVAKYVAAYNGELPAGVHLTVWNDDSEVFQGRMNLLLDNALMGLILVLVILGVFLEVRLAFWVTLGIPISFLGVFLVMPILGVSLNMISMFAFILTLGIVVDDAIVVGEAVYRHRQEGKPPLEAAIAGVREVAGAVVASVLTTVIAFTPLLFVPGMMGSIFKVIPLVVIPILLLSLIESLFVLPAHLSHESKPSGLFGRVSAVQERFSKGLERGIERFYVPFVRRAVAARYTTLALALAGLILTVGFAASGAVRFNFMPEIEGEVVTVSMRLPVGSPAESTRRIQQRLLATADTTLEKLGEPADVLGVFSKLGTQSGGGHLSVQNSRGSHVAQVEIGFVASEERSFSAEEFARQWRKALGPVAGLEQLSFNFGSGPSAGNAVSVELSHSDPNVLEAIARDLAEELSEYPGVHEIDTGITMGKTQLELELRSEARRLGVTENDLARQVRNAFWGAEVTRMQRGRDELRVYVRRPQRDRQSEHDLEALLIQTKGGGEVPLGQAANLVRKRSYSEISRKSGRRILNITADVDNSVTSSTEVRVGLESETLPSLQQKYSGLNYDFSGEQQEQSESLGALGQGFLMAGLAMFALMALSFRSYAQPLIVLSAIPFAIVGAILGHILMGFNLSLMSIMGMVALAGVVVNDSLVLVTAINSFRAEGMPLGEAVIAGGARRFRPVLLTSLTTFFGLAPMMLETAPQAQFLIPMAVSLGFGVLFVTVTTLILVPAFYQIVEDIRGIAHRRGVGSIHGSSSGESVITVLTIPEIGVDGSPPKDLSRVT